jgi:hypothetical protein
MPLNIKTSEGKPALGVPYKGNMTVQAVLDEYREELKLANGNLYYPQKQAVTHLCLQMFVYFLGGVNSVARTPL